MRSFSAASFGVLVVTAFARAQAPLYDIGSTLSEQFGSAVASIGDVDADGVADIVVGARHGLGAQADSGRALVYSMKYGTFLYEVGGEHSGDLFGFSVAGIGDINGDGVGDFVVGAPQYDGLFGLTDAGAVYVYSGANGALLGKSAGSALGDQLGYRVTGVRDVNFDGFPDFAASKPFGDSGVVGNDCGVVYIYSGAAPTSVLRTYVGQVAFDKFGSALCGISDVNGDGRGDLLVGAPYNDAGGFDAGRGYVVSGATSGTILITKTGAVSAGWFGYSVAAIPDIDFDGRPEIAFGEPFSSVGASDSGRVRVWSPITGVLLCDVSLAAHDSLGWTVAGVSDFDGDGRGDLICGATASDWAPYTNAGLATVVSGATGNVLTTITGYANNDQMGFAVASAGDLNNDGFGDVLAATPFWDGNAVDGGRVRSVLGNAEYPSNYCVGKTNSSGCVPYISFGGCASVSISDYLNIVGVNLLPNQNGIMIWSTSTQAVPFHGGTLCIANPIRTPVQTSYSNPYPGIPCDGMYSYVFRHSLMTTWGLTPGMYIYAQYWGRDNGFLPPQNIQLTNGIKIPILP